MIATVEINKDQLAKGDTGTPLVRTEEDHVDLLCAKGPFDGVDGGKNWFVVLSKYPFPVPNRSINDILADGSIVGTVIPENFQGNVMVPHDINWQPFAETWGDLDAIQNLLRPIAATSLSLTKDAGQAITEEEKESEVEALFRKLIRMPIN